MADLRAPHGLRRRDNRGGHRRSSVGGAQSAWRLFVNLPISRLDASAAIVCPCYLAAWIADDPADADGDPAADAPHGVDGHGLLLVRGAAYAAGGAVAEVEALVAQPCRRVGSDVCGDSRAVVGHGGRGRSLTPFDRAYHPTR